jgi:L-lactate dehydrogenase complex protein LldE
MSARRVALNPDNHCQRDNSMRVALFATCLVDFMRPSVGFAAVHLLQQAGCEVDVPARQTCCGQPAWNNGDANNAARLARQVVDVFHPYEYVIVPSGSCAGMLRHHYPRVLASDPDYADKARELADCCYELTGFLVDVLGVASTGANFDGRLTWHDSCSCLREMQVSRQPRQLLQALPGCELVELQDVETCCGFGGTFCVKFHEISTRMVDDKTNAIVATGADMVAAADLGCLLNIAGRISRLGLPIRVFHIAEILAGMTTVPGIGEQS